MQEKFPLKAQEIMNERFGCDRVIALATVDGTTPWVRGVNAFYEDGSFYVVTYDLSNKMRQIEKNPAVAVSGEWFTAHGVGESLGSMNAPKNEALAAKLRIIFAEWLSNGHTDEADPNTIILRVRLTDGVLFSHGTRYDIDFT